MVTITKGSTLMVCHKESASISGKMGHAIKETLNKDSEMGTDLGILTKIIYRMDRDIKDITQWIKSVGMASIIGIMDGFIRGISIMISEMDMDNFLINRN